MVDAQQLHSCRARNVPYAVPLACLRRDLWGGGCSNVFGQYATAAQPVGDPGYPLLFLTQEIPKKKTRVGAQADSWGGGVQGRKGGCKVTDSRGRLTDSGWRVTDCSWRITDRI